MKTALGLPALKYTDDVTCKLWLNFRFLRILTTLKDYIARLIIWNETEKWVVLIVGCIPPIRPLLMLFFHKIATSAKTTSDRTNGNGRSAELQSYSHCSKAAPRARHMSPALSSANESEENILAMEEGAIMKTTDIRLSYETGSAHRAPSEHSEYVTPIERI